MIRRHEKHISRAGRSSNLSGGNLHLSKVPLRLNHRGFLPMIRRSSAMVLVLMWPSYQYAQATVNAKVAADNRQATLKRPTPTIADYKYGDDSTRQVFDF